MCARWLRTFPWTSLSAEYWSPSSNEALSKTGVQSPLQLNMQRDHVVDLQQHVRHCRFRSIGQDVHGQWLPPSYFNDACSKTYRKNQRFASSYLQAQCVTFTSYVSAWLSTVHRRSPLTDRGLVQLNYGSTRVPAAPSPPAERREYPFGPEQTQNDHPFPQIRPPESFCLTAPQHRTRGWLDLRRKQWRIVCHAGSSLGRRCPWDTTVVTGLGLHHPLQSSTGLQNHPFKLMLWITLG